MGKTLVKFDFDPLKGVTGIKRQDKEQLRSEIASYVKEQVLSYVGSAKSPVTGGSFAPLSKEYRAFKSKISSSTKPNLELYGDMLDSLEVIEIGNKLRLTVGDDQQGKADGHNNFTGKSKLPERKFIPNAAEGENFDSDILDGIEKIIQSYLDDLEA